MINLLTFRYIYITVIKIDFVRFIKLCFIIKKGGNKKQKYDLSSDETDLEREK